MVADLAWDLELSAHQVWQREQMTLSVSVQAPDEFALLKTDTLQIPSMEIIPLASSQTPLANGNTKLTLNWQLYPHTAGKQMIQIPVMRYYLNGGTRAKWQPPAQAIDVQALPPYFPPTLPVGEVSITSNIVPNGILRPDSLAYWHISLQSRHVTSAQFPALLKQLQASQYVDVLPARITMNSDQATGHFQLDYRIPFKPKASGRLDLPTLQWHWFDPNTARLEKVRHQPPHSWVLAQWQQILLLLSSGLTLLLGIFYLGKHSKRYYRRWQSRQQVLKQLHATDKTMDTHIRHTMQHCAKQHGWQENLTIRQWLDAWQQYYGQDQRLEQALLAYEQRRFARNTAS